MTLTRAVPSSGCSQLCQMHSDAIIGSATEQAAAAHRRVLRRACNASKISMLDSNTHSVPPKTPVYSYHCTAQTSCEKPLPRMSHGHEKSPTVYQYSVVIHAVTSVT